MVCMVHIGMWLKWYSLDFACLWDTHISASMQRWAAVYVCENGIIINSRNIYRKNNLMFCHIITRHYIGVYKSIITGSYSVISGFVYEDEKFIDLASYETSQYHIFKPGTCWNVASVCMFS